MICALFALMLQAASPPVYADPPGLVLGVDAGTADLRLPLIGWPEARQLRSDGTTGEAWRLSYDGPEDFYGNVVPTLTEIYVVRGSLEFGENTLGPGDYARLGRGYPMGRVRLAVDTEILLFRYPFGAHASPQEEPLIVREADTDWTEGTVARDAGAPAPLMIRRLYTDPETGARTHLVRLAAGVSVPWEVHSTAEEGYLLSGDYHLAECLPSGRRDYDYDEGGYFYRPAGVLHSGPESTTTTGATWLIRTPRTLDAVFYASCPSALASEENEE